MTTVRHVARAVGLTGSTTAKYRVDLRVGRHQLIADEPAAAAGGDLGPAPFGLLLSALAACTATTLRMYAEHNGWDLTTIEVDARYNADDDDRRTIERTITVPADLTIDQHQRLADVAERTPVTLLIRSGTSINTTFKSPHRTRETAVISAE